MDWVISCITITAMELTIRKHWAGFAVSLGNQVLWAVFIYQKAAWGLVPLWVAMVIQASRGLRRWYKEAKNEAIGIPCLNEKAS